MFSKDIFNKTIVISLFAVVLLPTAEATQITLKPVDDVFIRLFGGGEGCVAFVKFNITSVPPGQTVDSVIIQGYVWSVATNWDGDAKFFNVNSQTWQESDSAALLHRISVSDSTHQASGFGQTTGWTRSVDVKTIFLRDYNASRIFCSFKIRDPDDRTMQPMPGALANDCTDTLAVGNRATRQHIYFYPHEYTADTSRIIRLVVYYQGTDISTSSSSIKNNIMKIDVSPNPFAKKTFIRYRIADGRPQLKIYNASGRLIRSFSLATCSSLLTTIAWDGKDDSGQNVAPGVYIYRFDVGPNVLTGKVIKLK